jgi:predicted type IV restriction endonuclease
VKEQLDQYVKQVKEWHEDCRGNEQATKASLIAPLFGILGYNMHDPRECKPEYRMDFGKGEKAATPVDWAFLINNGLAFFVEAKEAGARLARYPEQLGMYFGKQPGINGVKLGILTNGAQWQFFTDLRNENAMDTEPFFTWDVLKHDLAVVLDLLKILHKSEFTPQRIRTFAENRHHKTVLVGVIDRLLKPSQEFVKLALSTGVNDSGDTIVSGRITETVIQHWSPILTDAIHEWARQHDLTIALQHPNAGTEPGTKVNDDHPDEKPERYGIRKRFWEALLSRPKVKGTRHANIAPGEYSWMGAGSGVRGLPLNYAIGQDQGRVELWMDRGADQNEANKRIFDRLHSQKKEIEGAFGGELSWQRLDDKRGCRIAHITTVGGYKSDESRWPEIQDAMIEAMTRLEKALASHLAKLKTELRADDP